VTLLLLDVGSTFTKAALVDDGGGLLARAAVPTTSGPGRDVLEGVSEVCRALASSTRAPVPDPLDPAARERVLACSSAGGGLRLAVVGYERAVTAEAGHRVGLSAGARVVHVAAGPLTGAGVAALRTARPDVVLLVGGTDGGNAEVLVHNARRLARARVGAPVVVAGNVAGRDEVAAELGTTRRRATLTDNVLPSIGVVHPGPARRAIREVFLRHVIGGKGLSRGPRFARLVRAATPDAVLAGVEVVADVLGEDVLVVDVGGATTDVYSVLTPQGEDASLRKHVVETLWRARTVEGDLGMRGGAPGVLAAAREEGLLTVGAAPGGPPGVVTVDDQVLSDWVTRAHADPSLLPAGPVEQDLDLRLATLAATVAARRHGRPGAPGEAPRPLADVRLLLGSGGVLRHADPAASVGVLDAVLADHGGGWRPPVGARSLVDTAYLLFGAGLLAEEHPTAARALATQLLEVPPR
jgi:uncharacterized protein (TIGR01319 family)